MGVSSDELTSIADLHVKNCIMLLNRRLDAEDQRWKGSGGIEAKCQEDTRIKYEADVAKQSAVRQNSVSNQLYSKRLICTDARRMCLKVLMPRIGAY